MISLPARYKFFLLLFLLTGSSKLFSQDATIRATIDRNTILIGEQLKLNVDISFGAGKYSTGIIDLPDSLEHFEVVEKSKTDETLSGSQLTGFSQSFTLTSFDSGKWVLPPVKINLLAPGNTVPVTLYADSFPVTVAYSASDTSSQLRDIKPIRGVEVKFPLWYWIAAGVILLALIIFIIWFYRHWRKNRSKPANTVFKSKLPPFEEAVQALEALNKEEPVTLEEQKVFYVKLTDVFRRYLSRRDNVLYFNATSGDLLVLLNEKGIKKEILSGAASALRVADAVKFAKYTAAVGECKESLQQLRQTISVVEELMLTNKQ
ncbi:MAG: hypothetical protein QM791_15950 [Ferruginibacter sp.]